MNAPSTVSIVFNNGHMDASQYFYDSCVDETAINGEKEKQSPFYLDYSCGTIDYLRRILKKHPRIACLKTSADTCCFTPLHAVTKSDNVDWLELFLQYGAKLSTFDVDGSASLSNVASCGEYWKFVPLHDCGANTFGAIRKVMLSLHDARPEEHGDVKRFLLKARLYALACAGLESFYASVRHCAYQWLSDIFGEISLRLMVHGYDFLVQCPDIVNFTTLDECGHWTPSYTMMRNHCIGLVDLLLQHDTNIEALTSCGNTLSHTAVSGQLLAVESLLAL